MRGVPDDIDRPIRARTGARCGPALQLLALPILFLLGVQAVRAAPPALPTLPASAYTELAAAEPAQRLLAVVRCVRTERLAKGSRSERAVLHTEVIVAQPGGAASGSALVLTRYAQGPDPLLRGTAYLVAGVRDEYAPAYTLVAAAAVGGGALEVALPALAAAAQELSRHEPSSDRARPAPPPVITQAEPALNIVAAVEHGALVVRYTLTNPGPEAIFIGDRTYSQAIKAFEDDFAHIERDPSAGKLTLRRDGLPATAAQNPFVQRVPRGGKADGRIAVPLSSRPGPGGEPRTVAPWTVRRIALQLGWAPVSAVETERTEPPARVRHDGRELEAIGGRGAMALKLLTREVAVAPPVTLR